MQVVAEYLDAKLYLRADGERVDLNIASLESALSLASGRTARSAVWLISLIYTHYSRQNMLSFWYGTICKISI
jgi:hypothetical protein